MRTPDDDGKFVGHFLGSLVYAPHSADDPMTPLIITANIDKSIASGHEPDDTADGDSVLMGPWIWCFTSERRVEEIRLHPFFSCILEGGVAKFATPQLLLQADKNVACLVINPSLAFGRKFDLTEIRGILTGTA